jgi:hypothetical protein
VVIVTLNACDLPPHSYTKVETGIYIAILEGFHCKLEPSLFLINNNIELVSSFISDSIPKTLQLTIFNNNHTPFHISGYADIAKLESYKLTLDSEHTDPPLKPSLNLDTPCSHPCTAIWHHPQGFNRCIINRPSTR